MDDPILKLNKRTHNNIDYIKNKFEIDVGDPRDIEDDELRDQAYDEMWALNESLEKAIEHLYYLEGLTRHVL